MVLTRPHACKPCAYRTALGSTTPIRPVGRYAATRRRFTSNRVRYRSSPSTLISSRHRRRCGGLEQLRHPGEQGRQRRCGFGRRLDDQPAGGRALAGQTGHEALNVHGRWDCRRAWYNGRPVHRVTRRLPPRPPRARARRYPPPERPHPRRAHVGVRAAAQRCARSGRESFQSARTPPDLSSRLRG